MILCQWGELVFIRKVLIPLIVKSPKEVNVDSVLFVR